MSQNEHSNNIKAYKILFQLERKLRNFIYIKFDKNSEVDWLKSIPKKIITKCEKRAQREKETYQDMATEDSDYILNYSDFKDIKEIILNNWNIFEDCFIRRDLIENKLEELEMPRNVIAHNRIVSSNELNRISVYANDLDRCMDRFLKNNS